MTNPNYIPLICPVCGSNYLVAKWNLARGQGKSCSRICAAILRRGPVKDSEERFWAKVDQSGGSDACWIWRGAIGHFGYGMVRLGERQFRAHRRAWELTNGAIPDGLNVLHRCDNPPCVNPAHLFLGTNRDNTLDCVRKGRNARGERAHRSKLTESQVIEIRNRYKQGGITIRTLALEFGVSENSMSYAIRGKTWRHVVISGESTQFPSKMRVTCPDGSINSISK